MVSRPLSLLCAYTCVTTDSRDAPGPSPGMSSIESCAHLHKRTVPKSLVSSACTHHQLTECPADGSIGRVGLWPPLTSKNHQCTVSRQLGRSSSTPSPRVRQISASGQISCCACTIPSLGGSGEWGLVAVSGGTIRLTYQLF
ncbi:hypothetical protein THAOC_25400, partial [Thalassiosira oceanica]